MGGRLRLRRETEAREEEEGWGSGAAGVVDKEPFYG